VNLRPYQELGRDFLASRTRALLADQMRVGKTPQAVLACQKVAARRVLVVCPAIAVEHWRREWQKWADRPATVLDRGVWASDGVVIASYNRAVMMRDTLSQVCWNVFIVDECHFAKNPDAQRTKAVFGKDGLGWQSERIWALSGTPAPKHAGELWPILRAFGVVGCSYTDFTRQFCTFDWTQKITGTKVDRIPALRALMEPIVLRRTRKEVAPEMPEIDFQFLEVRPTSTPDESGIPAEILTDEQLLAWLESNAASAQEMRIKTALAKVGPLAEEIVEAFEGGLLTSTVVFGYHIAPLAKLLNELSKAGLKAEMLSGATPKARKQQIQDDFLAGGLQVVVGQVLAAGTAIDLSAASHGYFLELDWVPGNNAQAASRLVNMQSKEPVSFDVVTWPGSTDDRVQRVLTRRSLELSQLY